MSKFAIFTRIQRMFHVKHTPLTQPSTPVAPQNSPPQEYIVYYRGPDRTWLYLSVHNRIVSSCYIEDNGMLWNLHTIEGYRRRGYATALLRKAATLHDPVKLRVMNDNHEAQNLYTKLGFKPTDDYYFTGYTSMEASARDILGGSNVL